MNPPSAAPLSAAAAAPTPAERLLRRHHRWTRLAGPLATVALGLAVTLTLQWHWHPSLQRVEQWGGLPRAWAAGLALTFLAAAGVWLLRRQNLPRSAQRLDERLDAKNRLETAAVLRGDPGALAHAQREEAAAFLQSREAARPRFDPLPSLAALAAVLLLTHFLTLLAWTRPWVRPVPAAAKPVPPPVAAALPKARLQWKSPKSETKATPIEEVPLEAVADSTSGLRDVVLEIAVNGQPRVSVPVPAEELKAAGSHPVQASIYLDQVEVEPFDVVSYYLRAQRVDARPLPETTSSVQFVQIKRFRDDVRETPGKEGTPAFALITALKVAQLRLIKENFVLAHTDLGQDSPEWKTENGRVGGEQTALEKKTGEAVQQLIEDGIPAEIVDLLTKAQPFMGEAARKIAAVANQPALTPQGQALGLITEVEKFLVKVVAKGGASHGSAKPGEPDPFRDKQQFEMKQRFKTPGGELETLAAAQAKIAEDLARPDAGSPASASGSAPAQDAAASPAPGSGSTPGSGQAAAPAPDAAAGAASTDATGGKPPDPDKIEGTLAERQTQISQRVGALLNGRIFKPEIVQHLEQGRAQARDALGRIDNGDAPAAREPAAAAARELQLAADAMNRAGAQEAKTQLADAQRALNDAAAQAREAARQQNDEAARQHADQAAREAQEAARDLAEQARAQQESGSSEAAARLNDLARSIGADETRKVLELLRARPRDPARAQAAADHLRELADHAAQQQFRGGPSPEEIARLVERLERIRANLGRLAANGDLSAKAAAPVPANASATTATGDRPEPGFTPGGDAKPGREPSANPPPGAPGSQGNSPDPSHPGQSRASQPGQGQPGQPSEGKAQPGPRGQGQIPSQQSQSQPGQGQSMNQQVQPGKGQPGQGQQGQGKGQPGQAGQGQGQEGKQGEGQGRGQQGRPGQGRGQGQPGQPGQGQGQSEGQGQPGQGQPGQGQGQGQGQPGQGQGQGQSEGQGQPGQGQPGQGQGQGQPGQGRGQGQPGQGQGGTSSPQMAGNGSGTGSTASKGAVTPDNSTHEDPADPTRRATPPADPDLGDTYGTRIGQLQSGDIPAGGVPPARPTYTDHAPRAAQTRDPQQTKETFARELIEDVREITQDAAAALPKAAPVARIEEILRDVPVEMHAADEAALFARIDPPLLGLIDLLRAEAPPARREHQLTAKNAELAPPAYRPAVADYFEQLSRDYDGAPPAPSGPPASTTSPATSALPTP